VEGDANTKKKKIHLQACHRGRKSHIASLKVDDALVVHDNAKAQAVYENFNDILGTPSQHFIVGFPAPGRPGRRPHRHRFLLF
jgi:hypothetical protein